MPNVLYILEALGHNKISHDFFLGEPERVKKNYIFFFLLLRVKILDVLYIREEFRHNYMPGFSPG